MKLKLTAIALLAMALSACSTNAEFEADGSCAGIEVVVNYSGEAQDTRNCVQIEGASELAKNVLAQAGIAVEGTKAYGDAVVCRVQGIPSASEPLEVAGQEPHLESCEEMPPAFAYWGLWVKQNEQSDWEYAMEGIGSLQLFPGQSLGLAFSLDGLAPTPGD